MSIGDVIKLCRGPTSRTLTDPWIKLGVVLAAGAEQVLHVQLLPPETGVTEMRSLRRHPIEVNGHMCNAWFSLRRRCREVENVLPGFPTE